MIPAAAQVAATSSTLRVPAASASARRRGFSRCSLSRKDSANWSAIAATTALSGEVHSVASRRTIRPSDAKWYPNRPSRRSADPLGVSTSRVPSRRLSISIARMIPR